MLDIAAINAKVLFEKATGNKLSRRQFIHQLIDNLCKIDQHRLSMCKSDISAAIDVSAAKSMFKIDVSAANVATIDTFTFAESSRKRRKCHGPRCNNAIMCMCVFCKKPRCGS